MNWADKAGLIVALSIALMAALTALVLFVAVGAYDAARLYTSFAIWAGIVEIAIAVPLWALLRVIDLLARGGRRQRRHETAALDLRREPAPMEIPAQADQDLPQ